MKRLKNIWRLWANSIGVKSGNSDKEADIIAIVRTIIALIYLVTNFFIIMGVVRHWGD